MRKMYGDNDSYSVLSRCYKVGLMTSKKKKIITYIENRVIWSHG